MNRRNPIFSAWSDVIFALLCILVVCVWFVLGVRAADKIAKQPSMRPPKVAIHPSPKPKTYRITNAWDAVAGSNGYAVTGYELGIGTTARQYTRLIDVGTNLVSPVTGLLNGVIYHMASRARNQWRTGEWSPEFVWPWPATNTVTVPAGSEMATRLRNPDWKAMPTNVLSNPPKVAFFRGKGSKAPIRISVTNNIDGYQHRE